MSGSLDVKDMGDHGLVRHSHLSTDSFPNVNGASSLDASSGHLQTIGSIRAQVLKQVPGAGSLSAVVVGLLQIPFE